jgi:LysR family transcriptional regulator, nitrogen assimilation regulatory protein
MKFTELLGKGFSLDRLHTLIAVDEAGSIAGAAPDDESRQSLYSRQLTQLEKFFKTELKRKTGKTIKLTPAGKELARISRIHLHALDQFRLSCTRQPKEITLGAGDSLLQWLVLPRLTQIRRVLPGSIIELQDLQNRAICQDLQEHVIDFGLLRADLIRQSTLKGQSLGSFGYSLFIPQALWTRADGMSEAQLLQELPLVIQGGNTVFQKRLGEIAAKNDWKLNVNLLCESFPQAAQAMSTGQLAAILPDLAKFNLVSKTVKTVPLKSLELLRREIVLAWHPHRLETRPHLAGVTHKLAEVLEFKT